MPDRVIIALFGFLAVVAICITVYNIVAMATGNASAVVKP